jgi:hypothetical protein
MFMFGSFRSCRVICNIILCLSLYIFLLLKFYHLSLKAVKNRYELQ